MKSSKTSSGQIIYEDLTDQGWEAKERRSLALRSALEDEEFSIESLPIQLLRDRSIAQFAGHRSYAYVFEAITSEQVALNTGAIFPAPQPSIDENFANLRRELLQRVSIVEQKLSQLQSNQERLERSDREAVSRATIDETAKIVKTLVLHYELEDAGRVVTHFIGRPEFVGLLVDSARKIGELFGARPMLKCDSEDNLILEMPTSLSPDVAEPNYSKFLREWWLPRKRGIMASITLTLDYELG